MPTPHNADTLKSPAPVLALLRPVTQAATAPVRLFTGYRIRFLRGDVLAALTVALVAVPQSMAFAEVAGLPPQVGLYTMIIAAIVGGLLTCSRHLSIGPTNTMSIMAGSAILLLAGDASQPDRVAFIGGVAILAGVLQIGFALARLGDLVRYVSHSVIVGFSAGAGVLIAANQLPTFFGITVENGGRHLHGLPKNAMQLMHATGAPDWRPIAVGLVSLAVVLVCRRLSKWLPAYLLAVVAGGVMVWLAGWTTDHLRLVGALPTGLPRPQRPPMEWAFYREMLVPAMAISLVGMIEAYGIGKTLAGRTGDRLDANHEFVAQGITNLVAGVFRGMPATGSFSRSALNTDAGANTSLACVLSGVFTAVVFLTLAPAAKFIPMASIAAILFVIAYGLIDWRYAQRLFRSNTADLAVCIGTFLATMTIPLEIAVFVGVFLNIALYLRRAKQVYLREILHDPNSPTGLIERPLRSEQTGDDIVFLQIEGNLFFAAADELQERLNHVLHGDAKAVILRLKRTHMVDATVMHVLEQFAQQMHQQGRHVLLCGVRQRMKERMDEFHLTQALGEDHIFITQNDLYASAKAAIQRAHELTGANLKQNPSSNSNPQRPWAYEI